MKIIQKIKTWYRGKYVPPTLEEMFDHNKQPQTTGHFKPPLFAKIIAVLWNFWIKNWQFIIGLIAGYIFAKISG